MNRKKIPRGEDEMKENNNEIHIFYDKNKKFGRQKSEITDLISVTNPLILAIISLN
jgi:hypothetical protein